MSELLSKAVCLLLMLLLVSIGLWYTWLDFAMKLKFLQGG